MPSPNTRRTSSLAIFSLEADIGAIEVGHESRKTSGSTRQATLRRSDGKGPGQHSRSHLPPGTLSQDAALRFQEGHFRLTVDRRLLRLCHAHCQFKVGRSRPCAAVNTSWRRRNGQHESRENHGRHERKTYAPQRTAERTPVAHGNQVIPFRIFRGSPCRFSWWACCSHRRDVEEQPDAASQSFENRIRPILWNIATSATAPRRRS